MGNFEKCLNQIPVLYVRGTHYEIGLSQGRTFKGILQNTFQNWEFFNTVMLRNYATTQGKQIYDNTLRLCEKKFPFYIEELKGLADGSEVPFYKVFVAHIDALMTPPANDIKNKLILGDSGCTSILCNNAETILAQNEDAFPEHINGIYVIVADIIDTVGNRLEKFAAISYPGMLPGLALGFNNEGVVFTINTLVPKNILPTGTRAVNHEEVLQIISYEGTGIADGFSLNICYMNNKNVSDEASMYNIEIAPPEIIENLSSKLKSQISVRAVPSGESYVHCNKYLHLMVPEINELLTSSIYRHEAISKLPVPSTMQLIKNTLSDQSVSAYPVYRRCQTGGKDGAKTVATGIFDIRKREWSIYVNPPAQVEPTVVLSMNL